VQSVAEDKMGKIRMSARSASDLVYSTRKDNCK
jgi:hypothetical protein